MRSNLRAAGGLAIRNLLQPLRKGNAVFVDVRLVAIDIGFARRVVRIARYEIAGVIGIEPEPPQLFVLEFVLGGLDVFIVLNPARPGCMADSVTLLARFALGSKFGPIDFAFFAVGNSAMDLV